MKNYLLLIRVALLLLLSFPLSIHAEEKPSLRDLFEGHGPAKVQTRAGTDDVVVIDLTEWQNEYDETLTIGNGKKYKFTNGELKWIGGDAPLIIVTNGSSIEIAEGASFSHSNSTYISENIRMSGGTVILNGGSVNAFSASGTAGYSISMKSENNEFLMIDGVVNGEIWASSDPDNIIRIQRGQICHQITTFADVIIEKGSTDLQIENGIFFYSNNAKVRLQCELKSNLSLDFKEAGSGSVVVQGDNGYTITSSDVQKMSLKQNYYKNRFHLSLENNQVVLRENLSPKQTIHVSEPGALPSLLTDAAIDVVTELTVTGDLNADDLAFLEKMGKSKLEVLNMSDANIVKGGMAYVGTDQKIPGCFSEYHVPPGIPYVPEFKVKWWGTTKDTIPSFAFSECDKLREVMLPHSVKCIERGVFCKCQQLQNVTVGSKTDIINNDFCYDCPSLLSVKSASPNIIIQDGIIYNADQSVILSSISSFLKREEIIIPASVKTIYAAAFNSNTHIKILYFENSNDTIKIGKDAFAGSGLKHVHINRPCEMSDGVFYSCSDLTSISLLGIKSLPSCCLENCPNLKELVIPEGAEYVARYACYNSGIEKLTLPSTLKGLGTYCFGQNKKINNIYSNAKTPPDVAGQEGGVVVGYTPTPFASVDHETCVVHVPSGCVHAYKLDIERKQMEEQMEESGIIYFGWGNGWCDFKNIVCDKGNLKDLFDIVDPNASEDDPTNAMEGTDDVDVDEPSDGKSDLHLLFGDDSDDIPEGTEPKKDLHFLFDGEYGLSIHKTSSYEFKNINIDLGSHSIDHVIYVDGTLIININVYFINIIEDVKHVIYIRKGGRVIFRGGRHDIPGVVIHNEGGTIIYEDGDSHGGTHGVVNNSGTVTISGGIIGGKGNGVRNTDGGTVTITGGHIYGGGTIDGGTPGGSTPDAGHVIYSDGGRVNILGGDYDEGSSVWSEGSLWLDGSVSIRDYYIRRNITINIVNRIIVNWYFYFIDEADINCSIPLFKGDGYTLTEEDLSRINITLPAGYRLDLDKTLNAIIIVNTTGIDGVAKDSSAPKSIYSPSGISLKAPRKGLNIIDGKKVLVK